MVRAVGTLIAAAALLPLILSGCSGGGFGRPEEKVVDPNLFPANYRTLLVTYFQEHQTEMESVRDPLISVPALGQFGGAQSRYFVCLRMDQHGSRVEKLVVFFGGQINQMTDATGSQCIGLAYQPFSELSTVLATMKRQQ
jgi:hypothetical protein